MSAVPAVTLNDGDTIPQPGFGVHQIEPGETARAVLDRGEEGRTGPNPDTFAYVPG